MILKRAGRWGVAVYDRQTGKRMWVGTYDSKREARQAEAKAHLDRRRKRSAETCDSLAHRWVADYPRRRESTNIDNRERVRKFGRDFEGRLLDDIDRVEARAWALRNRNHVKSVSAMFSDAVRDNLCEVNPFLNLRLEQSRGRKDLVVPTEDELGEMILVAGKLHGQYGRRMLAPFIQIGAYSGLRPGELYGLRWGDIDFHGQTLRVERQFNHKTRTFTEPKNDSKRMPFLTPQAAEALQQVPQVRAEVFSLPKGGHLTGSSMSHYWKPVAAGVGRPEFTPHCLRHFYGTCLALRGVGPPEIAETLGHADGGKLAMDRYIHLTERDARQKVAAAFGSNVRDLRAIEVADG